MTQIHSLPAGSLARTTITRDLIIAFTPYLQGMARSAWRRHGCPAGADGLLDVESAAREGLLNAITRWRPGLSKPIIHLAARWILGTATTEARRLADGCVAIPQKVRRLCGAYRSLGEQHSPDLPTFLARSNSQLRTQRIVRYLAQSEFTKNQSLSTPGLQLTSESVSFETIADIDCVRDVLLCECTARQRLVFYLKFPELVISAKDVGAFTRGDGTLVWASLSLARDIRGNLARIAPIIGVSRERVRQIFSELLRYIRRKLE